jgi:23S rRNA (guanine745-N1)-methyltransferase
MLTDVVSYLACPHCGLDLTPAAASLQCGAGHVFDIARQGYVNLLPGDAQTGTADTSEMVRARAALLAAGHFRPIADALAEHAATLAPRPRPRLVVDVGAGTGYYVAAILERLPQTAGLALDLSKHAARSAARAHRRIGAVVCDVWRGLPVRSGVADLALSVFAPRNAAELWRVLRDDGALIVVTPTQQHLRELIEPLGLLTVDADKARRLDDQLGGHFVREQEGAVQATLRLATADAQRLALMGPSAWHTDAAAVDGRLAALAEPVAATLSVTVGVWRRRRTPIDLATSAR